MRNRKIIINKDNVCLFNAETIDSKNKQQIIKYLDTSSITRNKIEKIQLLDSKIAPFPSRAKRKVKDKTIIYSTVRPDQEHFGFLENFDDNLIVSTGFLTIDIIDKDIDPKFFYYAITRKEITKYLHNIAVNSVTSYPSINPNDLGNLQLEIPADKEIQQKIASVLSALDSKIELNDRINTELGAMAKTLYDYWFVQFDFPNAEGKPYKTSGGKMVWNEKLKREIPEEWNVLKLNDIISKSGTGLNPRDNFKLGNGENYYITIKNVKNGKIIFDDACDRIDNEALKIIDKRSDLQAGDILFTSIEPVGVTYFIHEKPKNWNINESVFTIRPNYEKISSEYLYMLLSSDEMKAFTKNVSAGSIHKGIRHTVLKTFKIPYKNKVITEEFSSLIKPILNRIYLLDNENQQLSELSDWLLPMLMNGQVTVK